MLSSDNIFGYTQYKKLNIGDIVSWSDLNELNGIASPEKIKKFGVITSLYIATRSERKVAIVKVLPLSDKEKNNNEREIMAVCIEIVKNIKESSIV